MEKFTSTVRRCVEDYHMINSGEHIAVALSGGKDSLALLCSLASLRGYYPNRFELSAITIDIGFNGMDFSATSELCRRLRVPYNIIKTDIKNVVFDTMNEKNPCSLCSKMRRGILSDTLNAKGIKKVALGHHRDDAIETFFLSLLYEGRISCFQPVTFLDRSGITQIRPLFYSKESDIERLIIKYSLPITVSTCPQNGVSKRQQIKELVRELSTQYDNFDNKIFGAMQRLPLKGFETDKK